MTENARGGHLDAITHFARGLGYARTGDAASARKEESQLAQLRDGLTAKKDTYWSNQVEVQRVAVNGWIAWRKATSRKVARRLVHRRRMPQGVRLQLRVRSVRFRWANSVLHLM